MKELFIQLTDSTGGRVFARKQEHMTHIRVMERQGSVTWIFMDGGIRLAVTETPEEIAKLFEFELQAKQPEEQE